MPFGTQVIGDANVGDAVRVQVRIRDGAVCRDKCHREPSARNRCNRRSCSSLRAVARLQERPRRQLYVQLRIDLVVRGGQDLFEGLVRLSRLKRFAHDVQHEPTFEVVQDLAEGMLVQLGGVRGEERLTLHHQPVCLEDEVAAGVIESLDVALGVQRTFAIAIACFLGRC